MSLKMMPKAIFSQWVEQLRKTHRVVGPRAKHGQFVFDEIANVDELEMDYPTTVLPPKKYLLPPREKLFDFSGGGEQITPHLEATPTVIMGLHTCDLHSIKLLDRVHETGYVDQHYQLRRRNTVLVSIDCLKPCMQESFCKSMGTLNLPDEFDIHLTDVGDAYAVDIGSEQGEALLADLESLRQPTEADYNRINRVMAEKWPRFAYRLDFDVTELPDVLNLSQRSSYWRELGNRCLACGMCTKVCPTCYCFNVEDEVELSTENGTRSRVWDSCQIDQFAVVAGGHNFRDTRALRQKHRFFRKGKYQYEAYGLVGCVGCGRCAAACLVHITPVETFNELHKRRKSERVEVGL